VRRWRAAVACSGGKLGGGVRLFSVTSDGTLRGEMKRYVKNMSVFMTDIQYGAFLKTQKHINIKYDMLLCPMSEIVCFLVLIFTYSHLENSLFFALD
jgi:hypothetical protein